MPDTSVYLLEVDAWTGAGVETLRYATHTISTGPHDTPANVVYDGRITDPGKLTRSLFQDNGTLGAPSTNYGMIELANADGGLDAWLDYGFDGRAWRLKQLPSRDTPVSSATPVFTGTLLGSDSSDAFRVMRLRVQDRRLDLQKPLLSARYAGTTLGPGATAEGDASLQGQVKPYVFGRCTNVPPRLANPFNLLYQVSAGAVSSIVVYDGAVALTNAGDFPALSSLIAATLIPGQYATSLANGIFRLGGSPALTVTADVIEGATLALRSSARVAQRMLALLGISGTSVDTATFDALHTLAPAEVGIFVSDNSNADVLIQQVLDSVGASMLPNTFGVFQAIAVRAPTGDPLDTFTLRDIANQNSTLSLVTAPSQEGQGVPAWSIVLNWGKVWQTMSSGDVAGVVSDATKALLAVEYQQATAQDATIKTAHLKAVELTLDTLLCNQTDAQAEAARRLAMYGTRRDRLLIQLTVPLDRATRQIGDVVELKFAAPNPRFGYEAGKSFMVIGRTDDFKGRIASFDLWG